MRKLLYVLVAIFLTWLVATHLPELRRIAQAFAEGHLGWLALAVVIQIGFQYAYAGIYQAAFAGVGVRLPLARLVKALLGSLAMNFVAAGSGNALYLAEARRAGHPVSRAAAGTVLAHIADFSTFAVLAVASLVYLQTQQAVRAYQLLGCLGLAAVLGAWSLLLILGLRSPDGLRRLLRWLERQVGRATALLRRPSPLRPGWAERAAPEYADAAAIIVSEPHRLWPVFVVAMAAHLVDLASVAALAAAFDVRMSFGALLSGFSMALLFWIVAVTPQGVGVVEGTMALVYSSLGVSVHKAIAISLAFRGLTFWLPMLLGFLLLPHLTVRRGRPAAPPPAPEIARRQALAKRRRPGARSAVPPRRR